MGFQGTRPTEVIQESRLVCMDLAGLTVSPEWRSGFDKSILLSIVSKSIVELEGDFEILFSQFQSDFSLCRSRRGLQKACDFQGSRLTPLVTLSLCFFSNLCPGLSPFSPH